MKVKNQYLKIWEYLHLSFNKWPSIKHQESPCSDIFRATKPLLKQKHCQKHLTWAKEKKNWTVAQWFKVLFSDESILHFIWKSRSQSLEEEWREAQNPCCLKSSVMICQWCKVWCSVSDDLGCHIIYWCWSTVNAAIYQEILEHFMLPSADKLYGDADFIFQQHLTPDHTAKGTKN